MEEKSNVWTRWRCRRCHHDIPASLREKYRQAVAARNGEWSAGSSTSSGKKDRRTTSLDAENKELRPRIEALEKKEGEGVQVEQGLPSRKKADWRKSGVFKKLDDQRRKLQKELRDIEKVLLCAERVSGKPQKSNLQQQLQEVWSKEGATSCQRTRKCRRYRNRYKVSRTKEDTCRKTVPQQKKRCGSSKRSSCKKRSASFFLSNKVDKNKMADAEMAAELQSLQAEERRGSDASQTGACCKEALWQQFIAFGANRIEVFVQRLQRETGTAQG